MSWTRVNRQNRCGICNRDSWCIYTDGSVLCMRVVSPRAFTLKTGEVGYFHTVSGTGGRTVPMREKKPAPVPVINCGKLMAAWAEQTKYDWLCELAENLGVKATSLMALGFAWASDHRAWAIPMMDGYGEMVGIRLRTNDGHKFAVRGSHQGIFKPECSPARFGLIVEGVTDCAAALTLGYFAVGRPNCSGGMQDVRTAFVRAGVTRAAIIADNDGPGMRGAETLTRHLPMPSCIMALPTKDLRSYVQMSGTRELLDAMIESAVWNQPSKERME